MMDPIPNTTPIRTLEDHGDRVIAVTVLCDERMVTASYDGMVCLWDLKTGVVLKKMEGHRSRVRALAASPDGRWIVSGDESGVLIYWNGQTGKHFRVVDKAHDGWIFSLDFSQDFRVLASGSLDATTKLWSCNTSNWHVPRYSIDCGGIVRCVRFSPHARYYQASLAVATDHNIQIYEDYTSRSSNSYPYRDVYDDNYIYDETSAPFPTQLMRKVGGGFSYSLAWTPNYRRLLSGSNGADPTIQEWDTSTWQQVGDPWKGHFENIHAISLNSSGTLLASVSDDNRVRLWRLSDRRTIAIFKHSGGVNCVAFSKDDKHLLSGGADKKISEWPAASEDTLLEDSPKDGLMKEQVTHQVSSVSFPRLPVCHLILFFFFLRQGSSLL
jgi:WD40 repeat protein